MHLTVTPAYGKDYTSKKKAEEAWRTGKDFIHCLTGQPLSVRDSSGLKNDGYDSVGIRYSKKDKQTFVDL